MLPHHKLMAEGRTAGITERVKCLESKYVCSPDVGAVGQRDQDRVSPITCNGISARLEEGWGDWVSPTVIFKEELEIWIGRR